MVEEAIASVATARYPRGRLEIIAIDDGSTDDTWRHMQRAAARFSGLVERRAPAAERRQARALARGFRRAKGEILVTVDSDSVVERDSLLAIAGPFSDARIGAVAGKVRCTTGGAPSSRACCTCVSSCPSTSCAARSRCSGPCICCPGALAAYRTAWSVRCCEAWETRPSSARTAPMARIARMTNFILAEGYDCVARAVVDAHFRGRAVLARPACAPSAAVDEDVDPLLSAPRRAGGIEPLFADASCGTAPARRAAAAQARCTVGPHQHLVAFRRVRRLVVGVVERLLVVVKEHRRVHFTPGSFECSRALRRAGRRHSPSLPAFLCRAWSESAPARDCR